MDNLIAIRPDDEPLPAVPVSGGERRRGARRACASFPLLQMLVCPSFRPQRAIARNVSGSGLGLYLPRPLPVGSRVALQARGPSRGNYSIFTARVIHATCQDGGWMVGCELARSFRYDELVALA